MAKQKPPAESKRRVKNPETFRERAIKATEIGERPKRTSWYKKTYQALKVFFTPFNKGLAKLIKRQPFKAIRVVLSLIGKILLPIYLRNSWRELRLVTWPSRRQSRQLTFAVLIFAIIFGAAIALVDYGLDKLFKHLLLK